MGPVRGRLRRARRSCGLAALAALPSRAWAEVCDKERPGWDGTEITALGEAITLFLTPLGVLLLVLTMLALRLRHQWLGLGAIVGWTILVTLVSVPDTTGIRAAAIAEGCIGSPALFIALVAAICVGTAIYTTPRNADG